MVGIWWFSIRLLPPVLSRTYRLWTQDILCTWQSCRLPLTYSWLQVIPICCHQSTLHCPPDICCPLLSLSNPHSIYSLLCFLTFLIPLLSFSWSLAGEKVKKCTHSTTQNSNSGRFGEDHFLYGCNFKLPQLFCFICITIPYACMYMYTYRSHSYKHMSINFVVKNLEVCWWYHPFYP